ncbi:hypothetical protein VUR80DRAFT_1952 [Thermomyces stellatus]
MKSGDVPGQWRRPRWFSTFHSQKASCSRNPQRLEAANTEVSSWPTLTFHAVTRWGWQLLFATPCKESFLVGRNPSTLHMAFDADTAKSARTAHLAAGRGDHPCGKRESEGPGPGMSPDLRPECRWCGERVGKSGHWTAHAPRLRLALDPPEYAENIKVSEDSPKGAELATSFLPVQPRPTNCLSASASAPKETVQTQKASTIAA